mgnify:CR=1 FL=1|jgi:hypothetical protein
MTFKRAMNILNADRIFLGLTWLEFIKFIERSPGAQKTTVLQAFEIYKQEVS